MPVNSNFSADRLRVATETKFSQTYQLPNSLAPGSIIVIASDERQHFNLQTVNPDSPNFIEVSVPGNTRFGYEAFELTRGFGERKATQVFPAIRLLESGMNKGDVITVRYMNFKLPELAQTKFKLPLYIQPEGLNIPFEVPSQGITLVADKGDTLRAKAPSIVEINRRFDLTVELLDRFGNLVTGGTPSLDLLVGGVFKQRIESSESAVQVIADISLDKTGIQILELRTGGGGLRTRANPIKVVQNLDYKLQWIALNGPDRLSGSEVTGANQRSIPGMNIFEIERDLAEGGNVAVLNSNPNQLVSFEDQVMAVEPPQKVSRDIIQMAVPEIPTDPRGFSAESGRLVEILAGNGTYEAFGIRHASNGNRIGFTGTGVARQAVQGSSISSGITAVWLKPGETLFEALNESRTYVTSGPRLLLEVEVNQGMPGSRVRNQSTRVISGKVAGTSGILAVELVKNGTVIDQITYGTTVDSPQQDAGQDTSEVNSLAGFGESNLEVRKHLRISFFSSSNPAFNQVDYPRNGREWIGYLKLSGAKLEQVTAPGFRNYTRQAVAIHPIEDSRIDFITWTRGQESSFLVEADFADDNAVIELNLKGGLEDSATQVMLRPPARFSGSRHLIRLAELLNGPVERIINVEGYADRVKFELITADLPTEQSFSFRDGPDTGAQLFGNNTGRVRGTNAGDFYYVRVMQIDDHFAISSPVWVGGFDIGR